MMALTPQEQALLDSLTAKATEPEAAPKFDSVEKILEYLVRTSSHFSANPEDREEMLAFLNGVINPSTGTATE
jgi:hypothetical protein